MKRFGIALGSIGLLAGTGALATAQQYKQTNLVANTAGTATTTDSNLINPWGAARSSGGPWWVANAGTGTSTLYNGAGVQQSLVVTVPKAVPTSPLPHGLPSGIIFNGSLTDFLLAPGKQSSFIFSTLDGSLAAWNPAVAITPGGAAPSTNAVTTYVGPKGSAYTGLTSALINGERFLYAANFGLGTVDVFDNAFNPVTAKQLAKIEPPAALGDGVNTVPLTQAAAFTDDRLPSNFVPYNVQAIGNNLVVTYTFHPAGSGPKETDGPGLGYVDIYSTTGKLLLRLEHGVWLNAPWGVALAPLDFGAYSHDLLIGEFGGAGNSESAGTIAAYDLTTGKFKGLLQNATGATIVIQGLWALSSGNVAPNNLDPAASPSSELYFAAGPNGEANGLFGYLSAVPTTLVQGNDQ